MALAFVPPAGQKTSGKMDHLNSLGAGEASLAGEHSPGQRG